MSIKSNLFMLLSLLAAMMLVVACGAQPEQATQSSEQSQEAAAGDEEHQGEEADDAHSEEEHDEEDEAHDEDEEHHEDEHDEAVELSAINLGDGEKLLVVATTNIVGDLVQQVGGDLIELTTMLPVGADPHGFAPTPQDAASVADAHVVFVNGLHLEEFLEELIENAGGEAPIVPLSTNVETREFEALEGEAHGHDEDDHDEAEKHDEEAGGSP